MWSDDRRTYGEQLRRCRHLTGMSLTDIAELLGVTRQAVSKWELGLATPNDDHRTKLHAIYAAWQG